MKTLAIGAALLTGVTIAHPAVSEDRRTISPRYIGEITGDPEKDSFGYLAADLPLKRQAVILLSEGARYVGLRTGDEEKDTYARVKVRREWTAEVKE